MLRRTFYYRSTKAAPKLRPELVEPVKAMIEQELRGGGPLWLNKNAAQCICQLKGCQLSRNSMLVAVLATGLAFNTRRPHQALGMKTPAEMHALAI